MVIETERDAIEQNGPIINDHNNTDYDHAIVGHSTALYVGLAVAIGLYAVAFPFRPCSHRR